MRTLSAILSLVILVVAAAGSAEAYEIFTPVLLSSNAGGGHHCTAVNKAATGKITVQLQIISDDFQASCVAVELGPQQGTWCYANDYGFGNAAYCKITTTNIANTRATIMVLGSDLHATAAAEAK
jgi:hypothetical protein